MKKIKEKEGNGRGKKGDTVTCVKISAALLRQNT
jgi:hypothetical protein